MAVMTRVARGEVVAALAPSQAADRCAGPPLPRAYPALIPFGWYVPPLVTTTLAFRARGSGIRKWDAINPQRGAMTPRAKVRQCVWNSEGA